MSEKTIEIPLTIKLEVPIQWGEEEKANIVINRRLKAKDFKGIRANDIKFDDMLKLCSRLTGEPMAFIEELDAADMFTVVEVINSFLPHGLATGDNP